MVKRERLRFNLLRASCLAGVDTGVYGVRILLGHPPEGVLDDTGGIVLSAICVSGLGGSMS